MEEELTTLTVGVKDRDILKKLTIYYKTTQRKLFSALVKIVNKFKPELKELLK